MTLFSVVWFACFVLVCFSKPSISKSPGLSKKKKINITEEFKKQQIEYLNKTNELWKLNSLRKNLALGSAEYAKFRDSVTGVVFSGQFTHNLVLQREPQLAAVYGAADTANALIMVTLRNVDTDASYIFEIYSKPAEHEYTTNNWKAVFPQAFSNGGNYTLNVECLGCMSNNNVTLYNVTFGDVYYCSGQSNMELDMHFTFSRNITYGAISRGKYNNIRIQTYNNKLNENVTYVLPSDSENYWWVKPDNITLDSFSATCWYFAQSLYDIFNVTDINIGLIDVSVGGTMIEQWTRNETVQLYCKETLCPDPKCGSMYNTLTAGFLNMTIKGILWYQGENNMYEVHGSWLNKTGYGCMEPFMVNQWREEWSVVPNTTPSDVPFGLVTLASGTSEGQPNMGTFRWAQLNNVDYMPNYVLSNTFAANAYDLGDPWAKECWYEDPSPCQGDVPYSWNKTNYYMGPIHPRPKIFVGERLAQAGYNVLYNNNDVKFMHTGPLLSSCNLDFKTGIINIYFNKTFLMGQDVLYLAPDFWYNESLIDTISEWSAMEINIEKAWYNVNVTIDNRTDNNQVIVSLGKYFNETILGVRYAWGESNQVGKCCGNLDIIYHPCPPASCPIKAIDPISGVYVPATPFWARINQTTGDCYCFEPQECGN